MEELDLLLALEDVEPPIPNRFPRLGRLGILEHDAVQRIGLCREGSTRFKVRFDWFRRRTSGVARELFTASAAVPTSSGHERVLIGETTAPPSFACEFTASPAAIS